MEVKQENGKVTISFAIPKKLSPSSTGKTDTVFSSRGNKPTGVKLPDGREIHIGVNAYVYPEA